MKLHYIGFFILLLLGFNYSVLADDEDKSASLKPAPAQDQAAPDKNPNKGENPKNDPSQKASKSEAEASEGKKSEEGEEPKEDSNKGEDPKKDSKEDAEEDKFKALKDSLPDELRAFLPEDEVFWELLFENLTKEQKEILEKEKKLAPKELGKALHKILDKLRPEKAELPKNLDLKPEKYLGGDKREYKPKYLPPPIPFKRKHGGGFRYDERGQHHGGAIPGHGGGSSGGRHVNDPNGNVEPGALIPYQGNVFPTSLLMPAGIDGNPGFEIMTHLGNQRFGRCQMSLIEKGELENGDRTCMGTTARHCVLANATNQRVRQYKTAYGEFSTEDVVIKRGPNIVSADVAVVLFKGEACRNMQNGIEGKLNPAPVLELPSGSVPENTQVWAGVRYFGKRLFGNVAQNLPNGGLTVDFNFRDSGTGGHQGGIHTGDSGGPLFTLNPSTGNPEIVGVLSAANNAATVHRTPHGQPTVGSGVGYYASGPGVFDFLQKSKDRFDVEYRDPAA